MNFGDAIEALKQGKRLTRPEWTENHAYIATYPEANGALSIGWQSDHHLRQVYHPNTNEILAEDWQIVEKAA